jgi:PAS domain S-box-containing protein
MDRKAQGKPDSRKSKSGVKVHHSKSKLDEKNLLATYERAPIGITECSPEGLYISVNEEFCRIIGYEKAEVLTRSIKSISHEADYEEEIRLHEQLIAGEIPSYQLKKRYVRKEGEIIWVQVIRSAVRDARGKALYTVGIVQDITAQRQAEAEIEFQAHLLGHVHDAIISTDDKLQITGWNHAAEELYGWAGKEALGRSIVEVTRSELSHEQKTPSEERTYSLERRVRENFSVFEAIHHHKDGHAIDVESRGIALHDENGKVTGYVTAVLDITQRKQIEKALHDAKEHYRKLFDLVPVAVYSCDANGVIQEFSQRAAEMWGRVPERNNPAERYCGSFKMYYPDGRFMPHAECPMARVLNGETLQPHELELLVERPDGLRRNVIANPRPVKNEDGEIVAAINCFYDITGLKQSEEALQQLNLLLEGRVQTRTTQLQASNKSLREEVAERKHAEKELLETSKRLQELSRRLVEAQEEERRSLARELHDRVGQTLSAMNMNLSMMNDQLSEDARQNFGSRMEDTLHLVAEASTLVRNVMADLRPGELDDFGLVSALQSYINEFSSRYEIKVLFDASYQRIPHLGPSIEITLLRIAQEAMTNVARHAHADQIILSLQQEENTIRMTIQDNGVGIPSLQESTRHGSHGLTFMRERVEAVGGIFNVFSTPTTGTTIEVTVRVENGTPEAELNS